MNKKGVMEGVLDNVLYIAVIFVVLIFFLAVISPTIFERSENLLVSATDDANLTNVSAVNMVGSNCVASTLVCVNDSGAGETVASGNYTFTASTCSIIGTDGGDYQSEEIECSYEFERGDYSNVTAGVESLAEETTNLIPVAFGIIALILIFVAIAVFRRQSK